jgi:hypothetical protein
VSSSFVPSIIQRGCGQRVLLFQEEAVAQVRSVLMRLLAGVPRRQKKSRATVPLHRRTEGWQATQVSEMLQTVVLPVVALLHQRTEGTQVLQTLLMPLTAVLQAQMLTVVTVAEALSASLMVVLLAHEV